MGALSDETVISRISDNFVPVAVNLFETLQAKDEGGELLRSARRQEDQFHGIWILSPQGRVLGAHWMAPDHEAEEDSATYVKKETRALLASIDQALEAFGPVKPRRIKKQNPLPYRGVGVQSDGKVCLAIHIRDNVDGNTVIDSLSLPAQEWSTFAPPKVERGTEWTVPEAVARRFVRVLSPVSDQAWMPKPEGATQSQIKARVVKTERETIWLTYSGKFAAAHTCEGKPSSGEARLNGMGVYDAKSKQMRSLILIFDGTYRGDPPWDAPVSISSVVEWRGSLR